QAPMRVGHQRRSTPMRDQWSIRLGRPFPSETGEGNNSPIGAIDATRLTGLDPGRKTDKVASKGEQTLRRSVTSLPSGRDDGSCEVSPCSQRTTRRRAVYERYLFLYR